MRIGILGGTFDPIHIGHLLLAEETRLALSLDRILFVPAAQPWRKAERAVAAAAYRRAMVTLAIEGNPWFAISDVELQRSGPTYTAQTLVELRASCGDRDQFWFILGSDALLDLPNWHQPSKILALARLAVVARSSLTDGELDRLAELLPGLRDELDLVPMRRVEISSTEIRRRLRMGVSTRYWLPAAVERYALEHGLYHQEHAMNGDLL